jgi:hypothetical protein
MGLRQDSRRDQNGSTQATSRAVRKALKRLGKTLDGWAPEVPPSSRKDRLVAVCRL